MAISGPIQIHKPAQTGNRNTKTSGEKPSMYESNLFGTNDLSVSKSQMAGYDFIG